MFWSKTSSIQSSYLSIPLESVDGSKMKVGELELMMELLAGEIKVGVDGASAVAGEGEGDGAGTVAVTVPALLDGLA